MSTNIKFHFLTIAGFPPPPNYDSIKSHPPLPPPPSHQVQCSGQSSAYLGGYGSSKSPSRYGSSHEQQQQQHQSRRKQQQQSLRDQQQHQRRDHSSNRSGVSGGGIGGGNYMRESQIEVHHQPLDGGSRSRNPQIQHRSLSANRGGGKNQQYHHAASWVSVRISVYLSHQIHSISIFSVGI